MKRCLPILLLIIAATLTIGCDEEEVFTVSQIDEIGRYLDAVEESEELFRTDSLLLEDPYILPFDNSVQYRDVVDSVARTRDIRIAVTTGFNGGQFDTVGFNLLDLGFGGFPYAEVTYLDTIHLTRLRMGATDTTETAVSLSLRRRALVLKVGDNSEPFSGWLLWGYNGGTTPLTGAPGTAGLIDSAFLKSDSGRTVAAAPDTLIATVTDANGETDPVSFGYTLLTQFLMVPPGDELEIRTFKSSSATISILANYESDAGFTKKLLATPSSATFFNLDTLVTPISSNRIWNMVCFQTIRLQSGQVTTAGIWCVPYRRVQ